MIKIACRSFNRSLKLKGHTHRLYRTFIAPVSDSMLVTLSLNDPSKKFGSNEALVSYLESVNLVTNKEVKDYLRLHDRRLFVSSPDYSLTPSPLRDGVSVSSIMMQAAILDTVTAVLRSMPQNKKLKILDVGCANGFLTFGSMYLCNQIIPVNYDDQSCNTEVVGIDIDEQSIQQANDLKNKLGITKANFGVSEFFSFIESQKDLSLIIFGVGIQYSELLTTFAHSLSENLIIIAPVFETENQQSLMVVGQKDMINEMKKHIAEIDLFKSGIQAVDLNSELIGLKLMPCFFSPLKTDNLNESSLEEISGINLGNLGITSEMASLKKAKKFKHMTIEELKSELDKREDQFKSYFTRKRKENVNFSLKDIIEKEILDLLNSIGEIKRIMKIKSNSKEELNKFK